MPQSPCRYGYFYGYSPLGSSGVAVAQVRRHKARSGSTPSIAALPDLYIYSAPRTPFEAALLGKQVTVPLAQPTYEEAVDSADVIVVSGTPLTELSDLPSDALGDYVAHLVAAGGAPAVEEFISRHHHRAAARDRLAYLSPDITADTPAGDMARILTAQAAPQLVTPNPNARLIFAESVLPLLAEAKPLADIFEAGGRLDLTFDDDDVEIGRRTGVAVLTVEPAGTDTLRFTADLRPDANPNQLPAVIITHPRGVVEVVPLGHPTPADVDGWDVASDWANAAPIVGDAARAIVTTARWKGARRSLPNPPVLVGQSTLPLPPKAAIILQPPRFSDFESALTAADQLAERSGLSQDGRRHLRSSLLRASGGGWRYDAFHAHNALRIAQLEELGVTLPPPTHISPSPTSRAVVDQARAAGLDAASPTDPGNQEELLRRLKEIVAVSLAPQPEPGDVVIDLDAISAEPTDATAARDDVPNLTAMS